MAALIEETSTITAKGQTTVPKSIRRTLGVDYGGKIVFRVENGRVTLNKPQEEHRDPALGSFLKLLETGIASGRHVRELPRSVAASLRRAVARAPIDLNEPLEGEVDL